MGLFGSSKKPGITPYELKSRHLLQSLDTTFSHRSSSDRERVKAAFHTALGIAADPDANTSSSENVIQADEFEAIVSGLEKGKVITSQESASLRKIADKPLKDY